MLLSKWKQFWKVIGNSELCLCWCMFNSVSLQLLLRLHYNNCFSSALVFLGFLNVAVIFVYIKASTSKEQDSVIKPAKQMLVGGVEQTGRQGVEPCPGGPAAAAGGGSGLRPSTDSPCDSERAAATCLRSPIRYVSCKVYLGGAYKLLGEKHCWQRAWWEDACVGPWRSLSAGGNLPCNPQQRAM